MPGTTRQPAAQKAAGFVDVFLRSADLRPKTAALDIYPVADRTCGSDKRPILRRASRFPPGQSREGSRGFQRGLRRGPHKRGWCLSSNLCRTRVFDSVGARPSPGGFCSCRSSLSTSHPRGSEPRAESFKRHRHHQSAGRTHPNLRPGPRATLPERHRRTGSGETPPPAGRALGGRRVVHRAERKRGDDDEVSLSGGNQLD